ncbi:hypothetical protein BKA70DRAFT_171983 [Coprinopsis sp. MPI-PUGE-AT-0042]|nr:hypothetical protein BKA70DRAFT_171983 [Coprinopsis sp. MPI-PUGE-AT-0042]
MEGLSDSPPQPYTVQKSSTGERPRIRLAAFSSGGSAQTSTPGTLRTTTGLLKPFRFQKTDENSKSKPFRFSSSVNPATPVKTPFLRTGPVRLGGPLSSTTSHNQPQNNKYGLSASPEQLCEDQDVAASPLIGTANESFRNDSSPSERQFRLHKTNLLSLSRAPERPSDHDRDGQAAEHGEDYLQYAARDLANLRKDNASLRSQNDQFARTQSQQLQELQRLQSQLSYASSQLESTQRDHEETRSELAASNAHAEEMASKLAVAEGSIVALNERIASLSSDMESLSLEKQQCSDREAAANAKVEKARKVLDVVRQRNDELFKALEGNKQTLDGIRTRQAEALQEVRLVRTSAKEAITAVESLSSSVWVSNAREARDTVTELQAELHSSRRVSDILRDQLHHSATLLVESKDRVKELEAEKAETISKLEQWLEETNENFGAVFVLDKKYQDVLERLVTREREAIDALAVAAKTEEELAIARKEIIRLTGIIDQQDVALRALRLAKEEQIPKLLEMQDVVNAREKDICSLRMELKNLHESKADLRALLAEAKKTIIEKEQELVQAHSLNPELDCRMQELGERFGKVEEAEGLERRRLQDALSASHTKCSDQRLELQALEATLKESERKCDEWKAQVDVCREALAAKENTWKQRAHEEAERNRQELHSKDVIISDFRTKLTQETRLLGESKERCQALEKSLCTLEKDVARLEKEKAVEKQKSEASLTAASDQLNLVKSSVVKLENDVQLLRSEKAKEKQRAETAITAAHEKSIQLNVIKSSLEKCQRDLERAQSETASERQRGEAALASALERHTKDIELHEKLQGAQERRAIAAEASFAAAQKEAEAECEKATSLRGKAMLLASKVEQLESDLRLKEAAIAGSSGAEDEHLRAQLETLRAENAALHHRATSLMERYGRGDLGDAEKELVNYVVGLTESSNEQLLIEKENEIRSRGNQLATCQQRIKALQKHIAELLPGANEEAGRLVNIQSLAASSSSPAGAPATTRTSAKATAPPSKKPAAKLVEEPQPSLTRLARPSDDDDVLTDLSAISESSPESKKRNRPSSPAYGETRTTKKRTKMKESTKNEVEKMPASQAVSKKGAENPPKGRQRKRRY